jgi:hypothetical protein
MVPRLPQFAASLLLLLVAASRADAIPVIDQPDVLIEYRVEKMPDGRELASRFGGPQIALLEKLNRADARHLGRLPMIVLPSAWGDELAHSPFPATYAAAVAAAKLVVVDQPSQAFAAYEYGTLVRWGPVSSGRQAKPTPSGLYHLNWRARSRTSTLSGEWRLNWYFNFHNLRGLAFHEFDLPGVPQSHACVRLLSRDAEWIFKWGESWTLDDKGQLKTPGTPVLILGSYAFGKPAPWQAPDSWMRKIALPDVVPQQ